VVPHQDGAGTIVSVGDGVASDRAGERVWVYEATFMRPGGTAAEYTVVPTAHAVRLPEAVAFDAGACLGIPALTAHRCLFADGPVSGRVVLVTGGAGAVGHTAIQLARWGGATVIATVSSDDKARLASEAGAQHVLNYKQEDVGAAIDRLCGGVDHIVDVDWGGNLEVSMRVLKLNAVFAGYASRGNQQPAVPFMQLARKNITVRPVLVYTMPETAKRQGEADVTAALESGALQPLVSERLPLEATATAHELIEQGRNRGNVVVVLGGA